MLFGRCYDVKMVEQHCSVLTTSAGWE